MSDFKKLEVWEKAHLVALKTHTLAQTIRGAAYTSLRSQMIRAAMSVPVNIVEGREQPTDKGFANFLQHSLASSSELQYHLILATDMGVVSSEDTAPLIEQVVEVKRMLHGFIDRLHGE